MPNKPPPKHNRTAKEKLPENIPVGGQPKADSPSSFGNGDQHNVHDTDAADHQECWYSLGYSSQVRQITDKSVQLPVELFSGRSDTWLLG